MIALIIILGLAAAFAVGINYGRHQARRNTRRVRNPAPHQAADPFYTVARLDREAHAFTDEALLTARTRAIKLKLE